MRPFVLGLVAAAALAVGLVAVGSLDTPFSESPTVAAQCTYWDPRCPQAPLPPLSCSHLIDPNCPSAPPLPACNIGDPTHCPPPSVAPTAPPGVAEAVSQLWAGAQHLHERGFPAVAQLLGAHAVWVAGLFD